VGNLPTPGTYTIDPSHSHVGFAVKHFGLAKVRGEFTSFEGTVTIAEDPTQSTVAVTIQADSFDSRDEGRDAHVRSADFLDVESHPTLTFTSTSVRPDGDDWIVTGDLTVRGTSRSVDLRTTFDGEIVDPYGMGRIAFAASTRIDRTDFGLTWNQALETGGLVVGKQVDITLEVEAVRPLSDEA
jgi:polyisoprenoid-binding protein YceI